jgi:hypothetical protein
MVWVFWFGVAVITALAAQARGRSAVGWFFLGLLFSLFALGAVLVMAPVKAQARSAGSSVRGPRPVAARPEPLPERRHARGSGAFAQEVVGESRYQAALSRIAQAETGYATPSGVAGRRRAELHCENDNPHDPQAVAVRIRADTVGYLPREDARAWRKALDQGGVGDLMSVAVMAKLIGGHAMEDGEVAAIGVALDLDRPYKVLRGTL